MGLSSRFREAVDLYRWQSADIPSQVRGLIGQGDECKRRVFDRTGLELTGRRILDIGPGQKVRQMVYFAMTNEVTGIDLDVIRLDYSIADYMRMMRENGPIRTAKTFGRKMLGIDRKFQAEMRKQMGVTRSANIDLRQMDATVMDFEDATFDFVYSFSVFEHLPDPPAVLKEVTRVLKPGGVAYISLHLFTADNGCHDTRIFCGNREELPYWPHLRPDSKSLVRCNAYLNEIRLDDWRNIYRAEWPGVDFIAEQYRDDEKVMLSEELQKARSAGDLTGYNDDELMTVDLVAIWQKPGVVNESDVSVVEAAKGAK